MPRKPRTATVAMPVIMTGAEPENVPPMDGGADDVLAKMRAVFQQSNGRPVIAKLFRKVEGRFFDIGKVNPDDLFDAIETARAQFGGGDYEVIVYDDGKFAARHPFSLLVPPGWKPATPAPVVEAPRPVEVPAPADPFLRMMLEQMREDRRMLADALARLSQPAQVSPPADPFAVADKVMGMMTTLVEKMGGAKTDNSLQAVQLGIDIAQKAAGAVAGEATGSTVWDVVREGIAQLPHVAQIMTAAASARPAGAAPAGGQSVAALPAPSTEAPGPVLDVVAQVRMLLARARAKSNPETYAEVFADNADPSIIAGLLNERDPVAMLAQLVPEVAGERAWFEALFASLRELCEDGDGLQTGPQGSDIGNGGGNPSPANDAGNTG